MNYSTWHKELVTRLEETFGPVGARALLNWHGDDSLSALERMYEKYNFTLDQAEVFFEELYYWRTRTK